MNSVLKVMSIFADDILIYFFRVGVLMCGYRVVKDQWVKPVLTNFVAVL